MEENLISLEQVPSIEHNLSDIVTVPNFSMMICAKRRTGKSVFMRDLVSQIAPRYKSCHVFSKSLKYQGSMYSFCPKANQVEGFDESTLKKIWTNQDKYIKEETSRIGKNQNFDEHKKTLNHILIIFDDVIGDNGVRNSKVFDDLFILGRHLNIAVICLSQYYSSKGGISVIARKNLDYLVSFYLDNYSDKEHVVNDFMSKKSKKEGILVFNKLTTEKPYRCIIICNDRLSIEYEDYVFPYVANPNVEDFSIPCTSSEGNHFNSVTVEHTQRESIRDPFISSNCLLSPSFI